jgi:hypothetical protein
LLAKFIDHCIVGDAAQSEGACRLFHHYEVSRAARRVWWDNTMAESGFLLRCARADAVRWAEEIMREIDNRWPTR